MKAVVLVSGGMDSATALGQALSDGAEQVIALSVRYGSLHQDAESRAAVQVVDWYNRLLYGAALPVVEHRVLELPSQVFAGGHSALLGETEMPHADYQDVEHEGPSETVVPFRNANLISLATAIADANDYDKVYVAVHANDHNKWAYPDCSPEFMGAMANAVYVGTMHKVRLVFPFIWMTKADIVTRAAVVGVPLQHTWSCYQGGDVHCGVCPTCKERLAAFFEAGYADPVEYALGIDPNMGGEQWPFLHTL